MTRRILYSLSIPRSAQMVNENNEERAVSRLKELSGESAPPAEGTGSLPSQREVTGSFRGKYAHQMAREIQELFSNSTDNFIVPFFGLRTDGTRVRLSDEGYYTLKTINAKPPDPRDNTRSHYRYTGSMTKAGTRKSHWRAIRASLTQVDNNPFGSTLESIVGVDTAATNTRWLNPQSMETEQAGVQTTEQTEHGAVDIYEPKSSSYGEPSLIYDIPYEKEHRADPVVWDTYGYASKTTTVNNDEVVQWARVYNASHLFEGSAVVDNGSIRITFDEDNHTISAERWDEANSTWNSVSLTSSDWELNDLDLTQLGQVVIDGYVQFRDTTTSPTSYYPMRFTLSKGSKNPLWYVPANEEDPIPSGLESRLDSIANANTITANPNKDIIHRREVRE